VSDQPNDSAASPSEISDRLEQALFEIRRVIAGQDQMLERVLVCLLAQGHLLIEGVPGLAKTLTIKTTAGVLGGTFARVQFTPDLVPADLVGTRVYRPDQGTFDTELGPVFCNFLLADEINRTPPKTQAALLEAMEERQVSVDGLPRPLPDPFMVIATQNPVEHHGTYPLPESQLDRFLMRLRIGYPDAASERRILQNIPRESAPPVASGLVQDDVLRLQDAVHRVTVDDSLIDYLLAIVERTRSHESLTLGVSPRGSQALYRAVQAVALIEGRDYAIPDDVKRLAVPLFAHRVVINTRTTLVQRRADMGERIIEDILSQVEVPL